VPFAVNCCVSPFAIDGFAGVTATDTSVAAVTVSVVLLLTAPSVAEIVVVPIAADVASPFAPAALLIEAVVGVPDAHVTVVVLSWVDESVYVPVAVNCCLRPFAIEGFEGATASDTSVAAVTVRVVLPETTPIVAEIDVVPMAALVARPREPAALLMVAVAVTVEAHVAVVVRLCVVASV
jgi:hypothetical protein